MAGAIGTLLAGQRKIRDVLIQNVLATHLVFNLADPSISS
jgi:hypothetical protein